MSCTGAVRVDRRDARGGRRRDRGHADHRARARPAPTTARPRPRWRTASGGLLLAMAEARATTGKMPTAAAREHLGAAALRHRRLGRRRQVDADRPAALRLQADLRGPARARGARRARGAATATSNLALLTDGLRAEREQGITIDVAYRYFSTPRRKFIIADTPGHVQYTRNMVTGASTADLSIILVDARKGVVEQSRRHAFISSLLDIPHLVVAVNKMDLVDYDEEVYDAIVPRLLELGDEARRVATSSSSRSPRCTATTWSTGRRNDALVRGPVAALPPRARAHRLRPQPDRQPLPGAVGHPAETDEHHDYRGYAGAGRERRLQARRRRGRAAVRRGDADRADRHLRRARSRRRSRRCR